MSIREVCYHCFKTPKELNELDTIEPCAFPGCQFPVCSPCERENHKNISSWSFCKYGELASSFVCQSIDQVFRERIQEDRFKIHIQDVRGCERDSNLIYWFFSEADSELEPRIYKRYSHLGEVSIMQGDEVCYVYPCHEKKRLKMLPSGKWVPSTNKKAAKCTIPVHEVEQSFYFWDALYHYIQKAREKGLIVVAYFPEIKYDLSDDCSPGAIKAQHEANMSLLDDPSKWGLYLFKSDVSEFKT